MPKSVQHLEAAEELLIDAAANNIITTTTGRVFIEEKLRIREKMAEALAEIDAAKQAIIRQDRRNREDEEQQEADRRAGTCAGYGDEWPW
jgi:hypothetical protein